MSHAAQRDSEVKALTLHQPWATLVALGEKRVETRSWATNYRGPLLIHAGAKMSKWDELDCHDQPIFEALLRHDVWPKDLPLGAILCVTSIIGIGHTEVEEGQLSEPEVSFGNYAPGRYAWHLGPVYRLEFPFPARGSLGLWELDVHDHVEALGRLLVVGGAP